MSRIKSADDEARVSCLHTKYWTFRLLAVTIGLFPFVVLEVSLRLFGWQPVLPVGDPFIDFQSVRPLFVCSDDGSSMVTAKNRLDYFRPESFAVNKPPNEYRIVCLGGSTVQGRPYAIETSFTTWLELSLAAADPAKRWEVINCGGVSYASYRMIPILEEMLQYQPDLVIIYTGHNEFLEDRSYAAIKQTPEFVSQVYSGLAQLRFVQLCHQFLASDQDSTVQSRKRQTLSTEVDALLDYQGGLADYHRDPAWRRWVVQHFRYNLCRMVHLTESAGVPLILVDPPANLLDCPPFKIEDTAGSSSLELAQCARLVAEAQMTHDTNHQRAIESFQRALAVNREHAGLHYQLGLLCAESSRTTEAKHHLQRAIEEDLCPLRIIEPIRQAIRDVAIDTECAFISVARRFESLSDGGIPGDNLFVDHVHPTFRGHQVIAEEIMSKLQELNVVKPDPEWVDRRDARYRHHWKSLETGYFERGRDRLEALRKWSQNRSSQLRVRRRQGRSDNTSG